MSGKPVVRKNKILKLIRITTVPQSLKILLKGQHRFMSENGFEVLGVASSGKVLEAIAQDENIRIQALEITRTIAPLKDLKALWLFYKLCKKEKPTIVHSHTPKAGIIGMVGARLAHVPIRLHTVAGLPLMEAGGAKRKLLNFIEKLTYQCATKVYPNSQRLLDFILEEKFAELKKLKVIGNGSSNGIDTMSFNPYMVPIDKRQLTGKLGIQPNDFVFIFVGRLVGDKGINELVTAFKQIGALARSRVCKLLLVGSFEAELDPLETDILKEIGTNSHIVSVGFQSDVRPYFAIADALVFPSYREGFPNVVMQAGAMGLPAIVTDINGCNEIIIEERNGLIIPAKNVEALKNAMVKLMENKGLYRKLQSNARQMIKDRYEQQMVWQAMLEEYKYLLKEKGLSAPVGGRLNS